MTWCRHQRTISGFFAGMSFLATILAAIDKNWLVALGGTALTILLFNYSWRR